MMRQRLIDWMLNREAARAAKARADFDLLDGIMEIGRLTRVIQRAPKWTPNEARKYLGYDPVRPA